MEVTAAERTTIYTNISPLAQRVNNYIQTQHSSIAAVAKDIGYSRTTVSRYLTGKYDSNPNDLESKLTDFLTRQTGEAVDLTTPLAKSEGKTWQTPVFFESRDAKAVLGVCQSCQEYIGLGIVVARSGYGKTYALRQYAKLSRVAYIECDDTMSSRDLVEAIERSIGLPNGYGTIWRRVNGIREFFNTNKGYLLIIDEADKLVSKYTQKKMEILRAVFDQSDVGLVIAGEPKLEAQIKTYLVRMANRVDFYASLRGLSPSEVEGYLTGFQIEPEALVELKARACNMFDLLFAPLKKGRKTVNQLRIFFKVMGREFDDLKAAIFRVRSEANVASCSEVMLPVHGQDRDMPRLEGEDAEAYRTRLSMKGIISQWSGTRRGVLYALTALGYDRSRIELFADQDAERWAEFIIFLNSSKPSGITNLSVIDGQVRKVKEGSSKPAYGMETIGGLIIQSWLQTGFSRYPRCGEIVCGVWPHIVSEGHLVASTVMAQGGASGGGNPFPRAGTFAASEEFYHFGAYTIYQGFASDIEVGSKAAQGAKVYLRCSTSTRCSTNAKGGAAE